MSIKAISSVGPACNGQKSAAFSNRQKDQVTMEYKISLILSTVGRTEPLARFLDGLTQQTYQNFELILVDQNSDSHLKSILNLFHSRMCILHLGSKPGL